MRIILSLFILMHSLVLSAYTENNGVVRGTVKDESGEVIPFVTIQIKNSTNGTVADNEGKFSLRINTGKHTLVFRSLGFITQEIEVNVKSESNQTLKVVMFTDNTELNTIEVVAFPKDIAKMVMENASEARTKYAGKIDHVEVLAYQKQSVMVNQPDTVEFGPDSVEIKMKDRKRIDVQRYLIETHSQLHYDAPRNFREDIRAFMDHSKLDRGDRGNYATMTFEVGEHDITPQGRLYANPFLLESTNGYMEIDFNRSMIDLPFATEKKLLSPLAPSAFLNYKFNLGRIFYRDGMKMYEIQVDPLFRTDALFKGTMIISDGNWAVHEVDLCINPEALFFHKELRIRQHYIELAPDAFVPVDREISYTIKNGLETFYGNLIIDYSDWNIQPVFGQKTFTDEVQHYDPIAFDQPMEYWNGVRTAELAVAEKKFVHTQDSMRTYFKSPKYLAEVDSEYNQLKFWDFVLTGIGYRNRIHNYQFFLNPLVMQVNPLGIGGYRHRLGGNFKKEFSNAFLLEGEGDVDYGFKNKDIRGKGGLGLTYIPLKFVRTFIRAGDYYEMVNTYASIGSIFSRSNYVRSQTLSISQRMEVVNGLFAELTLDYSDQKPITNLKQDNWSSDVFGTVNKPIDFQRYIKSEIKLELKYKIKQKYIIKKNKKILLGSKYPELSMVYRKGIPGLFHSEVDFDYIEFGAKQSTEIGRIGNIDWNILAGSFVNHRNLRILEHRYFRGSDKFFFSDPTKSFQLLGPTLNTADAFYRANCFMHFNGLVLNKIPLLNRLKLSEAAGAGILAIPNQNFSHVEFFAGIERAVRIKEELFRFGIYACTADNSFNKASFQFKLGINFYDTFNRKWSF